MKRCFKVRLILAALRRNLTELFMGTIKSTNKVLHHIRVKLYPNYLKKGDGAYLARTENDSTLGIEEICTALKDRGGFGGNLDELIDHVKQFLDEMAYQLCDGFAVSTGYFSIHPNIGGTFNSAKDIHDPKKNPVSFRFRTHRALRELIRYIEVTVGSTADTNAFIDEFTDRDENAVNSIFIPGNMFSITGSKIKVAGDNPNCGVFFVPVDDPSKAVMVTRIGENNPTKIFGIAPKTDSVYNRIEIRTQFTGSGGIFLKSPRVIKSDFIIEAA
jgi:hypothetical protein